VSANIDIQEAQAWTEKTKLDLGTSLDGELEASISAQVIGQIAQVYDTSSWSDSSTTPRLVRSIVAMLYVAWYYDRSYSEDAGAGSSYGALLRMNANTLLTGIVAGNIALSDVTPAVDTGQPAFFPTDTSTAADPLDTGETSDGPEKFSIGTIW
jgi:hypothetical protein